MIGVGEDYRRDGYRVHERVLSPSGLSAARAEVERLWADPELTRAGNGRTRVRDSLDGVPVVDRLDPVCDVSPRFDALARSPEMCDLAAAATGQPMVLFKDKIIVKPAGAGGYGLHQDYMRWQHFGPSPDEMVTLAVAIDDAHVDNGAVEVYLDQHRHLLTPPGVTADPHPDDVDDTRRRLVELSAGDVMAFHPLAPHRSGFNRTDSPRRMLFLTYSAATHGDLRDAYYLEHRALFADALDAEVVPMRILRREDLPERR